MVINTKHRNNHKIAHCCWRLHSDSSYTLDTNTPVSQGSLELCRELPFPASIINCVPLTPGRFS